MKINFYFRCIFVSKSSLLYTNNIWTIEFIKLKKEKKTTKKHAINSVYIVQNKSNDHSSLSFLQRNDKKRNTADWVLFK